MDQKGNLQSRLRKICTEIDEIKNEEKKELSKIEEKLNKIVDGKFLKKDLVN